MCNTLTDRLHDPQQAQSYDKMNKSALLFYLDAMQNSSLLGSLLGQ